MNYVSKINPSQFKNLSIKQKRVAIAQDVIDRIFAELLSGKTGNLFSNSTAWHFDGHDLQGYFNSRKCEACAKGALICSWVGNFNSYNNLGAFTYELESYIGQEDRRYPKELIEIFGYEMLGLIEIAFEGVGNSWNVLNIRDDRDEVDQTYFEDLYGIMRNIVANDGEFVWNFEVDQNE